MLEDYSVTPRELTLTPDILQVSWNIDDTSSRPNSKQIKQISRQSSRQGSRQGSRHGNRLRGIESAVVLDSSMDKLAPLVSTNFKPVKIE